jgi:hypothetical protein
MLQVVQEEKEQEDEKEKLISFWREKTLLEEQDAPLA